MKNDLLYASPLDHYFSNLKKKELLKNGYFICQRFDLNYANWDNEL